MHDVHADAAPVGLGDFARGGKSRLENHLRECRLTDVLAGRHEPVADCLQADRIEIESRAVVGEIDGNLAAHLAQADGEPSALGLAGGGAIIRQFDAVRDGIAQHVLHGGADALQDAAVEFDLAAVNFQGRAFAQLLGGLAHRAIEALGQRGERHAAQLQEIAVQIARHARLLRQRRLGFLQVAEQRLLHQ